MARLLGVAEGVGGGAEADVALRWRLVGVAPLPAGRQRLRAEHDARVGVRAQARLRAHAGTCSGKAWERMRQCAITRHSTCA